MKLISSLAGGFAGACAVTLLNQLVKKFDKGAPRIDLLGQETLAQVHEELGTEVPGQEQLYKEALATDLLSNTIYFSIAGTNDKHTEIQGGMQGIMAGLGAVYAPGILNALNVNPDHTAGTDKKKALTTAYYFIGGMVAAEVMKLVEQQLNEKDTKATRLLKKMNKEW
jgi:formamidopyrimidine-DNA glycosylase